MYSLFRPSLCASLWQMCPRGLISSRLGSNSSGVHHCHSELPIFFSATKPEGRAYVSVSPLAGRHCIWVHIWLMARNINKQVLISQKAVCLRARKQMGITDQHPVNRFSLKTGGKKKKLLISLVSKRRAPSNLLPCVRPYNDNRTNHCAETFGVVGLLAPPGSGALLSAD